jgi:hypothetical protein
LQAQITIIGDAAHYEAWLVDRRYDQATGRAVPEGNDNVAKVVRDGMKGSDISSDSPGKLVLVSRDRGSINEIAENFGPRAGLALRLRHFRCALAARGPRAEN